MRIVVIFLALFLGWPVCAETARIAVASNFATLAETLAAGFHRTSGHEVTVIPGSTGKLYAQIAAGAPFDAFLSADETTPIRLAEANLAVPDSRFTYAIGTLVLWSREPAGPSEDMQSALRRARYVAIANPKLAPYGKAAMQSIVNMGLLDDLSDKIVMAENVGQTFAMVQSGAADIGFVAASSLFDANTSDRVVWPVPPALHDPILQDAVLLRHGRENLAAIGFLDYLRTWPVREEIRSSGYEATP